MPRRGPRGSQQGAARGWHVGQMQWYELARLRVKNSARAMGVTVPPPCTPEFQSSEVGLVLPRPLCSETVPRLCSYVMPLRPPEPSSGNFRRADAMSVSMKTFWAGQGARTARCFLGIRPRISADDPAVRSRPPSTWSLPRRLPTRPRDRVWHVSSSFPRDVTF